jgi:hypothetical protein
MEENVKYCPKCGTKMSQGALFCSNCGTKVSNEMSEGPKTKPKKKGRSAAKRLDYAVEAYNLGCMYFNGEGTDVNYDEAFRLFMKAASQGLSDAQNMMGYCYENGKGVKENDEAAKEWYSKAAAQGNKEAKYNLRRIKIIYWIARLFVALVFFGIFLVLQHCSGFGDESNKSKSQSYSKAGYEYVVQNLSAPSTAKLLSVVSKEKMRELAKTDGHFTYSKYLDWEIYEIEAENAFGGRVKNQYVVTFWKDKPIVVEDETNGVFIHENIIEDYLRMITDLSGLTKEQLEYHRIQ